MKNVLCNDRDWLLSEDAYIRNPHAEESAPR